MYKKLFFLLLFAQAIIIYAQDTTPRPPTIFEMLSIDKRQLFVKAEALRFFTQTNQTEYHINYKILNKDLVFLPTGSEYKATLNVSFDIYQDGQLVSPNSFEHTAGALSVASAQTDKHFVLDKIEFTIPAEGYSGTLTITDKNASTHFTQRFDLPPLTTDTYISDIEISTGISTELTPSLDKFQRGQYQFYVDPLPVISSNEKIFIAFFQVANITPDPDDKFNFFQTLTVSKDDTEIWKANNDLSVENLPYLAVCRVPINDFTAGIYTLQVDITDSQTNTTSSATRTFLVTTDYVMYTQRVFPNDDDEYELLSYFLNDRQKRLYRDLNDQSKKGFIDRFWASNNPNPMSDENQFLQAVRLRIQEANWRYSHHRAGWKTDMGRIYIKHGTPDDVQKSETPPDARFPRRAYEVWKYQSKDRAYLFLDLQNNRNFRLIHTKNDDTESTDPAWKNYFGDSFDYSKLDM